MIPRLFANSLGVTMFGSFALQVAYGFSHTLMRVLPYMAGMGVVFAALSYFSPCNAGKHWWSEKGLTVDLCYWFIVPVFTRYGRIGFVVLATTYLLGIHSWQGIIDFYDHGHGPLSRLPYWLQIVLYLITTEFALYWIHRFFHSARLWKYHAVHHSSEDLEWISAVRFHPVNLLLGSIPVDVPGADRGLFADDLPHHGAVRHADLRLRARQSQLDSRTAQVRLREPGLPSLASRQESARQEFCRDLVPLRL